MDLFLYGTLRLPQLLERVAGGRVETRAATLPGYRVVREAGGTLPFLVEAPGEIAAGLLIADPSPAVRARLDAYELPFGYRLAPVTAEVDGVPHPAGVYLPGPEGQASDRPWRLDEWEVEDGALTLLAAEEFDLTVDEIGPEALARNWHMVRHRASARLRAAGETQPATLRHAARPGEVERIGPPRLSGRFFRHAAFRMRHRTFSGGTSPDLDREALLGADAALVLPYDAATGEVLLIEQVRTGPILRGAANPWMLEPPAGIVDAGETPEEAARRETWEETGLAEVELRRMFTVYASPGSTTDVFHCFAGLADLSGIGTRAGGLAVENEDLRTHVLPLDAALALIDTGEINVGPLVMMLLWTDRHRAALAGPG
ncbi:NUDIX domain-containing protein [Wenxinia marina]|uniref:ADP-ribose pyrophosphatase n=1 Tax=Wenxinia marina DSM 24838 TaxID=1123501 RepID=A0A0D0QB75_9RHOB|nr:NUDIX domain-containing protein [Wenxinia marina]KIQ69537.1 nudix-type nucleoside diphosphatase, YffH/AdpP family [Wenxinia marina DSM 24838]GGL59160.1 tellurite resistance protein [Wenxinia marina]